MYKGGVVIEKTLNMKVSEEFKNLLKKESRKVGLKMSQFIRLCVYEYLKRG